MYSHISVLLHESVEMLGLGSKDIVVDATVGLGGHSKAFLEKGIHHLICIDQDTEALKRAQEALKEYSNVTFIHGNFGNIQEILKKRDLKPTVIFADIGVSSLHLDDPKRGFSFRNDAPLDMRMDQTSNLTARDILEKSSADELEEIFREYGELSRNHARKLTENIVEYRSHEALDTTFKLVALVDKTNIKQNKKSPLPMVFQALRIAINDELGMLERMLESSFDILSPGGRMGVISFHSLEDRKVKQFMKYWNRSCICPKEQLQCNCKQKYPKKLEILKPFPVKPDEKETKENPRSRSARLRVARVIAR